MHFLIAASITAFVVGLVVTYVTPTISAAVPASMQTNKWVSVAVVGALTLVTVMIAGFALRTFKLPRLV